MKRTLALAALQQALALSVPSAWPTVQSRVAATPAGARLAADDAARAEGGGEPHRASTLRLFGKTEADVRVTFYRDSAAWCPYVEEAPAATATPTLLLLLLPTN
jgi:hypothetical protein